MGGMVCLSIAARIAHVAETFVLVLAVPVARINTEMILCVHLGPSVAQMCALQTRGPLATILTRRMATRRASRTRSGTLLGHLTVYDLENLVGTYAFTSGEAVRCDPHLLCLARTCAPNLV